MRKREGYKYGYTLPAMLFVVVMIIFPIIYTVRISFYNWTMSALVPPEWVGLRNYAALLADERFWKSVYHTVYFSFSALVLEVVLGVAIAILISRKMRFANLVKALFLLPMVATPVAVGLVWMLILEPSIGIANKMLAFANMPVLKWLASPSQVIPSLIIVDVWEWTPMVALIVMAGLTTLPSEPYEAAEVDGASGWQKFIYITLPLLKQTILVAAILRFIDVFKAFDIIYVMTQGGPNMASETLAIFGYLTGFQYYELGMASSIIVIFLALMLLLILPLLWFRNKSEGMQ